jgi:hypothetical protein
MSHRLRWLLRGSDFARYPDIHRHLLPPPNGSQSVWCKSGLPDSYPWKTAYDIDFAGGAELAPQGQARSSCLKNLSRKTRRLHHH